MCPHTPPRSERSGRVRVGGALPRDACRVLPCARQLCRTLSTSPHLDLTRVVCATALGEAVVDPYRHQLWGSRRIGQANLPRASQASGGLVITGTAVTCLAACSGQAVMAWKKSPAHPDEFGLSLLVRNTDTGVSRGEPYEKHSEAKAGRDRPMGIWRQGGVCPAGCSCRRRRRVDSRGCSPPYCGTCPCYLSHGSSSGRQQVIPAHRAGVLCYSRRFAQPHGRPIRTLVCAHAPWPYPARPLAITSPATPGGPSCSTVAWRSRCWFSAQ